MNNQQTTNAVIELADKIDPPQDKEKHMKDYITSIKAIEDAMEPFKEQRKDLRESYNENGWLTKEEMRLAIKAYRLYKSETDMEILTDYVNKCQRSVGRINGF